MRSSGEQATVRGQQRESAEGQWRAGNVRGQQCEDSSGEKATVSEQRSESSSVRATV